MINTAPDNPILTVRGLRKFFPVRRGVFSTIQGYVRAVDGVDFSIARGRTLGLVGESGSGKTTVGRTIMKLIPASAGQVVFNDWDVMSLRGDAMRHLRRRMQIIFQDPFSSLNPRMRVGDIVAEPMRVHRMVGPAGVRPRVAQLLERVGLAAGYASRYPHEFSGGQRQRIGIARALASNPEFIVCDEPVSALDVSVRAQILNLLQDLQDELGLSYLFIAHDLAVVEHFADEIAVMYLGRIVEMASKTRIIGHPRHPYTESLLSAVPRIRPQERTQRIRLQGEMPSPINPPSGCPFHPRCPLTRQLAQALGEGQTTAITSEGQQVRVVARCTQEVPALHPTADDASHCHACLLRP
ncbi:MAG: ATP-binding cassette domain-containing protein [Planctomycetaceae bacterium]|nr:ATP-binding cassette domain-containing protein [Planctomycetaceae bacterium]